MKEVKQRTKTCVACVSKRKVSVDYFPVTINITAQRVLFLLHHSDLSMIAILNLLMSNRSHL